MQNKPIIGIIVQARLGSSRLPGKVFKQLGDKVVLEHVIDRLETIELADHVIIATTNDEKDIPIVEWAEEHRLDYFRGSEDNVLSRFYEAAREYELDTVVRITSDCPFIDPVVCQQAIEIFLSTDFDMVTNGGPDPSKRTFPRGMDVSVFSFETLQEANQQASSRREREHVTPYMYDKKRVGYLMTQPDYSNYRLTLDTTEDLEMMRMLYPLIQERRSTSYLDIVDILTHRPDLVEINQMIIQKTE